ncbi:MAG: SDR family NAD(P)-dependent oxidoreductase, partial [Gammaproteobacteria bacterium]
TACSSALVALHEACASLRMGESDLIITGGVNVILAPQLSINFSKANMLAADGYCKTFDKDADGYVRGEGCGVVILKRLSDAQKDHDRILAVIKGSAVNQDGASSGLTVPNGPAQEEVIKHALQQAKLNPDDIDYIEAHGTGTSLGDPIEVNAISQVFNNRTSSLTIGTVKTNIGHLEAAAGIAGLIKTILALQHEEIPKHLHFKELNPSINLEEIPAQIPLQAIDWKKREGKIRRAGISSFGFSGTNAHIIIEAAPTQDIHQVKSAIPKPTFNRKPYWAKALSQALLEKENVPESTVTFSQKMDLIPTLHAESMTYDQVLTQIRGQILTVLGLPIEETQYDEKGFFELGMDSLMAAELGKRIQKLFPDIKFDSTVAFDYPSIAKVSEYIKAQALGEKPTAPIQWIPGHDEPIAVIGMSCRFPGGANSTEEFWQLLEQGFDAGCEIPKSRWDNDEYYTTDKDQAGKIYVKKAGLLNVAIEEFDANFFGLSPREAIALDPQQRLLLETSWEALEAAGIAPKTLQESATGVFIGIYSTDYRDVLSKQVCDPSLQAYLATGNAGSTASGRISYTLGLKGPSFAIDTACSSSLVALHQACVSLREGESDLAITGGVNVILSPEAMALECSMQMLSPEGMCKTFDKDADGFMRGEGCGVIILKRLSDAQKDHDKILAIIKSSAVNQDGASSGLTVPNGPAQEAVIRRALVQAQVTPGDIDYIEAHGTGTSLGDPIEVNAIKNVFADNRQNPLIIGTVKTNIGHLEAAAGIAGIIKTILSLQHEKIPAHLHFKTLNPAIYLEEIPVQIPLQALEWKKQPDRIRRAGVSSFGFSGTNVHVVLEEAPVQDETQQRPALPKTVFNRQRYWAEILAYKKKRNLWGEEVHPLLGVRLLETAEQGPIIYEQNLALDNEDIRYLKDHKVYGEVIYPGAGYIELILSAVGQEAAAGESVELKALNIERPLVLSSTGTRVQVVVDKETVAIYSKTQDGWQLHSQCIKAKTKHLYIEAESLATIEERIKTNVDQADFYAKIKVMGIEYGEAFQVIQSAKVAGNEALVYLQSSIFDTRYAAYPALLDGGLQGLGLLVNDGLYLPFDCESIEWYQAFSPSMVAHIHLLENTKETIKADINFYSGDQCVMRLKGYKAKHTSKTAMLRLLAHHMPEWYYEIAWEAYEPSPQEISKQAVVYDARRQQKKIGIELASALLSYLQKQIAESKTIRALYIITENAYGNPIDLSQSTLNGFIKTAILEHPELNIVQLDVTEGEDIERLIAILNYDAGKEQILQYRQGQWYCQKIVKQTGLHLPASDYRLIKDDTGLLDKLELVEEEPLIAGDDEIIIEPKAVGLNFRDVLNAMNLYPGRPGLLGGDLAGIVKEVGKNITRYQVGDEVLGLASGSLASQAITQEALIIHKPAQMTFCEAASIPTIFMTAYLALVKLAKLKANETVLIHAGAGGVGLAAIQIAMYLKAKIICTAGSESKRTYLQNLGIEHVFDSRSLRFKEDVLRITDHQGVDVVLNALSGKGFIESSLQSCALKARFVEIGKRDIWNDEQVKACREDVEYHILALDQMSDDNPSQVHALLQEVMQLFNDQILMPVPKTIFLLLQAVNAFKYLQQAKQIGKVIITLPPAHVVFKEHENYLITGGLGGIGLEIAHYLSEHGAKHIILAARHAPSDKAKDVIVALQARGVEVSIEACDVSQEKQVQALCKKYVLKGIFHTAGVIEDVPLDKQTPKSFAKVFAAKAQGAWYLHQATQKMNLDYFVLFSSIASLNGSVAQANYATANSFLDALAQYRAQHGLKAQSIQWGPWREVGMAKDLIFSHERQGMKPFSNQEALKGLTQALKQDSIQLGIINASWKVVGESLGQVPSWLEALVDKKLDSSFIQALQSTPIEQREGLLKQVIIQEVKKVLGQMQMLDEKLGFFEMGMDSLMSLELKNRLQGLIGQPLSNTLAFDYPTIDTLVSYLASVLKIKELPQVKSTIQYISSSEPIAVIGMSCRFPGGANSPEAFWQLLAAGFDSSIEVPKTRWDIDAYYDANPDAAGKIVTRKGCFINVPIDEFDAEFFNISPREAEYLDPQQRLLLETSWEAICDAGIDPHELRDSNTGVFIGMSSNDYGSLLEKYLDEKSIEAYFGTGNAASTATGRISYTLGLKGPCLAIDTACSSALVALHEACASLRMGESDLIITGGVNVILAPQLSINFSQAKMLSPDGHCKTFDKDADGYVRGEGCGIIILKRLSDAQKDHDRILAVIKGSAVNQDGASSGLTVPNGPAQEAVIKHALQQAKLNPDDIDYIEAHGTGTSLGDPIEMNAISHVFKDRTNPLTIGAVKTNIGHLEAAAGIAGLIKTILSLGYEKIPRHLHFKALNPSINLEAIPAQIPLNAIDWKKQAGKIRRAGISSFGFSGTNAHVILEEPPHQDKSQLRLALPKPIFNPQRYWIKALDEAIENQLALPKEWYFTKERIEQDLVIDTDMPFQQCVLLTNDTTDKAWVDEIEQVLKKRNIVCEVIEEKRLGVYLQGNPDSYVIDIASDGSLSKTSALISKYQTWLKHAANIKRWMIVHVKKADDVYQDVLLNISQILNWEYDFETVYIDVSDKAGMSALIDELCWGHEPVVYLSAKREVERVVHADMSALLSMPSLKLEKDVTGSYLITGGLGGLGFAWLKELLQAGIKHIVLCSRRSPAERQQQEIDAFNTQYQAHITHQSLDISDKKAVKAFIKKIPLLQGVFHFAGNETNAAFEEYTKEQMENILQPKLAAWYLHELTRDLPLKYFVLFSSIASFFGSNRQGPYIIANGYLDALARVRKEQHLVITHIQWGPWKDAGMVMNNAQISNADPAFIDLDRGMHLLKQLLAMDSLIGLGVISPKYAEFSFTFYKHVPPYLKSLFISEDVPKEESGFLKLYYQSNQDRRYKLIQDLVETQVKDVLHIRAKEEMNTTTGFFDMGMDSLMAVEVYNRLHKTLGNEVQIRPMLVFDYPTIMQLATYLHETLEGLAKQIYITSAHYEHEAIAVIGLEVRFPGGANDQNLFWNNLVEGKDGIRLAEKMRWDSEQYPYKAGFIDNIDLFDASFFNISAREAEQLDPQQRLLLETTWHALEDSGINPTSLKESETGIFIGISQSDYGHLLSNMPNNDFYQVTGNALNAAAGRLSYTLGLQGPAMAIDTACSSSLVALHEACRSLENHECDIAIAAGVNVLLDPKVFATLMQGNMLSADGYCKTFDKDANGYVRGEGCGVVILKRLSDAQKDNSRIYALIKGSAVNQDGASSGLTVPNALAQEKVMAKALANANVEPNTIDYIEAHGTGTSLGDPIEIGAIKTIYGSGRTSPLIISTVKTSIGHLESAAGIAGVIKTILSMQHEVIPKHLHFKTINPSINLDAIPAQIPLNLIEWKKQEGKIRRAAISSFGFSGTNAHVILEEAPVQDESQLKPALPKTVFNR